MCGFVGLWRWDGERIDVERLAAARDRLRTRGPDDAGLHVEVDVGLAHRRLSIIDLSPSGRMPMTNEAGDIWAVFNGEIYNFAVLRSELLARGHVFRSATDSEVILHAYEQWGTDCFPRFDGMFAIAVWDRANQRLVLARDIAGEKPLYYTTDARGVRFGSTLDAVCALLEDGMAMDHDSVVAYAQLGYVPAPRSLVAGVHKLEPGTFAVWQRGSAPSHRAFWSLREVTRRTSSPPRSLDEAADSVQAALRNSVRARLVADVPLGAFLSGGIDSSLVVALMAEVNPETTRTFTIGFDDARYDESQHARRIAAHLGVQNTTLKLTANDVLREVEAAPAAFDEPLADASVLPSLAVARLARQHVTVALTGDGADEAFGGYRYYAGTRLFESVARVVPQAVRRQLAARAHVLRHPLAVRAVQRIVADDAAAFFARSGFHRGGIAGSLARVLRSPLAAESAIQMQIASSIRALTDRRPTEAGLLWDATHTLPDAWLVKVDRTTMAFGLEARAPFLQRDVLELAFRLPLHYRVHGMQKKIVLRRVLSRYLPRSLFERPKQGFAPPLRAWFANELRQELHDRLSPTRVARLGVFDPAGVQALLAEQRAGTADHTQMLWALFALDRWYDQYVASVDETLLAGAAR